MIQRCLDEVEQELLRVGQERCDFLLQDSRLTAVILLLLRCVSLLRSIVDLFRLERLDALDSVRRAFLESWHLAFQFRLENVSGEAGRWLARSPKAWAADLRRLDVYARGRGHRAPNLARDYGDISGLAHPTRDAAENSVALITRRRGINTEPQMVDQAIAGLETTIPALLYRFLWLVLDQDATLLPLQVEDANIPNAVRFANQYPAA